MKVYLYQKSRRALLVLFIVLSLTCVGFIRLHLSAASPFISFEAESGSRSGNSATLNDSLASGGSALTFGATTPPSGSWPEDWNDARFNNNTTSSRKTNNTSSMVFWDNLTIEDTSGQPSHAYGNYTARNNRVRAREGPRISGSNILIEDSYFEVNGSSDDHADGVQAYNCVGSCGSMNFSNVVIRRTKLVMGNTGLNAGIFLADNSGVDLTLEHVYVDGSNSPNGALFIANVGTDRGCNSLTFRHVRIKASRNPPYRFEGLNTCTIHAWEDVAIDNGNGTFTPIPNPGN